MFSIVFVFHELSVKIKFERAPIVLISMKMFTTRSKTNFEFYTVILCFELSLSMYRMVVYLFIYFLGVDFE